MTNLRVGQYVKVRERPAVITDIKSTHEQNNPEKIINIKYIDGNLYPSDEWIHWQSEFSKLEISKLNLPNISEISSMPDSLINYKCLINSIKWNCHNKLTRNRLDDEDTVSLISPWHNAIQIEDYQLYPVLKALLMPRVSLLLADDVGLGKTIEAGLILSELISRKKVQRVMVVCPASLQHQWQDELLEKFNLDFTIIDREQVSRTRMSYGVDSNPWTMYPRIITSMDYLRQPDVLESFRATAKSLWQSAKFPLQMLIVDEAHNLSPSVMHDDSDRCKMLKSISRFFEHRLFLSATPHNGYTVTFSGLLSILDPIRIHQTPTLNEADKRQLSVLMVRRLKSEIVNSQGVSRFVERVVESIPINLKVHNQEGLLYSLLRQYRKAIQQTSNNFNRKERIICEFIITLLTKRLLSSTYAFAKTWWQYIENYELEASSLDTVVNSIGKAETDSADDNVKKQREEDAARQSASWLGTHSNKSLEVVQEIGDRLCSMGWTNDTIQNDDTLTSNNQQDAKLEELVKWISHNLLAEGKFRKDERLLVFTEYKDTLDYLVSSLRENGFDYPQVESLYGGIDSSTRITLKNSFNDPASPLRILVATDAAAEGLNLHINCRYVIHYDIPWNPMRLEQRNGRVDRHGQVRDVSIFHFNSDDDEDHKFLSLVIRKVNQAREDLGSLGQVINQSVLEHFNYSELSRDEFESRLISVENENTVDEDAGHRDRGSSENYQKTMAMLKETEARLGLTPNAMAMLLQQAVEYEGGQLIETEERGVYKFYTIPPGWKNLIQRSLAIKKGTQLNSIPKLVFDPSYFETDYNERILFRIKPDTALIRLGHPIMQRAVSVFQRKLWEGNTGSGNSHYVSRWTITRINTNLKCEGIIIVYCLLEVTNELSETVHQEFVELPYNLDNNDINEINNTDWEKIKLDSRSELHADILNDIGAGFKRNWISVEPAIRQNLENRKKELVSSFSGIFKERLANELKLTKSEYEHRIKELEKQDERYFEIVKKKHDTQVAKFKQTEMWIEDKLEKEKALRELEWEAFNRENRQLIDLLNEEKEFMLSQTIPNRYTMNNLELLPIAVEFVVGDDK